MLLPYRQETHGSFDEEWGSHRGVNDWWYVTGYLRETECPDRLYSYQFTVFNPRHFRKLFYVLNLAFTDMQTGEHLFQYKIRLPGRQTGIHGGDVKFLPLAELQKGADGMRLTGQIKGTEFNLRLGLGKGAFWHGDNGVVVIGLPENLQQRAVYYSYTNLPTSGSIKFTDKAGNRRECHVTGKSWFDRQWGPFHLFHVVSFWEWFSLRFFDDEEVMLFAFPQHSYYDGTFIDVYGHTWRIRDYHFTYHTLKQQGKLQFPYGWDIELPGIKKERYRILPINDGQYNLIYYEILARVLDMDGNEVGYCFVELLPGTRQNGRELSWLDMLLHH
jgi:predicted secreted hydrolase